MGLISFGRNFTIGKPDPTELVRQWYWFEEAFWHQKFLDAANEKAPLPEFDFPFTDEDIEMTSRLNAGWRAAFSNYSHLIPDRSQLIRARKVQNYGGGPAYYPFYTANPENNVDLMMGLHIYVTSSVKYVFQLLEHTSSRFGRPVANSALFLSQFKKEAFMFDQPGKYFRLQANAYGNNLAYKSPGRREEIRKGFFNFVFTRDPNVVCRRLDAGESGCILPTHLYFWLEGHIQEGRRK